MILSNYERQSWYIRWYRWWRHMPLAVFKSMFALVWWIITGMQLKGECNKRETIRLIWRSFTTKAEYKMGNCVSIDKIIQELREQR